MLFVSSEATELNGQQQCRRPARRAPLQHTQQQRQRCSSGGGEPGSPGAAAPHVTGARWWRRRHVGAAGRAAARRSRHRAHDAPPAGAVHDGTGEHLLRWRCAPGLAQVAALTFAFV